jgi:hypothetical protein
LHPNVTKLLRSAQRFCPHGSAPQETGVFFEGVNSGDSRYKEIVRAHGSRCGKGGHMEISPVSGSVDATRLQQATAVRDTQAADSIRQQKELAKASEQNRVQAVQQPTTNLTGQMIGKIINTQA